MILMKILFLLGTIHNCQRLNVYKTYTLADPPPPQKVYISTFFKWIICHENYKKNWDKMLKVYRINIFFIDFSPPPKRVFCTLGLILTIIDSP